MIKKEDVKKLIESKKTCKPGKHEWDYAEQDINWELCKICGVNKEWVENKLVPKA
jgi:hypothetical protein